MSLSVSIGPIANGVAASFWNGQDAVKMPNALFVDARGGIGPLPHNRKHELKVDEVAWEGDKVMVERQRPAEPLWSDLVQRGFDERSFVELEHVRLGVEIVFRDFEDGVMSDREMEPLEDSLRQWSERIDCLQRTQLLWDAGSGFAGVALSVAEYFDSEHPKAHVLGLPLEHNSPASDGNWARSLTRVECDVLLPISALKWSSNVEFNRVAAQVFQSAKSVDFSFAGHLFWGHRLKSDFWVSQLAPNEGVQVLAHEMLNVSQGSDNYSFGQSDFIRRYLKKLNVSAKLDSETANALAMLQERY